MIDFAYYKDIHNGGIGEMEFDSLLSAVCVFLKIFMESYISQSKQKETIEEYQCNIDDAICYEIDYIAQNGGLKAFQGASDTEVSSVTTSGFKVDYGAATSSYNGIPLSPLSKSLITKELRKKGYMNRCMR